MIQEKATLDTIGVDPEHQHKGIMVSFILKLVSKLWCVMCI
jgi:hypothetical protein